MTTARSASPITSPERHAHQTSRRQLWTGILCFISAIAALAAPVDAGGCCLSRGIVCADASPEICDALGGFYLGDGTDCAANGTDCTTFSGACCVAPLVCFDGLSPRVCVDALAGTFLGDGTVCDPGGVCPPPIEPLAISCPADTAVGRDESTDPVDTGQPTMTGGEPGCDPVVVTPADVTIANVPPDPCNPYRIVRTWTAVDNCGETVSCDQIIQVIESAPPDITCPPNVTIEWGDPDQPPATGVATASDIDDPNPQITWIDVITTGACPNLRTISRTWTATDSCGNESSCVQIINVVDTEAPDMVLPADTSVEWGTSIDPSVTGEPTGTDNCSDPADITFTAVDGPNIATGPCPAVFSFERTWTATDECGNAAASAVQIITLNDTTGPVGDPPPQRFSECHSLPVIPPTIPATDNCDLTITQMVFTAEVSTPGACKNEYLITRTWTATDACGNAGVATQLIFVQDNTAPTIGAVPGAIAIACLSDIPDPDDVTAIDNCASPEQILFTVVETDNGGTGCAGDPLIIERAYTATDPCGNASSVTQTITVEDDESPTLVGLPASVAVVCGAVPPPALVSALDNCTPDLKVEFTEITTSGVCADTYVLQRSWTATDACGNSSGFGIQTITVTDVSAPAIDDCPPDLSVHADAGGCDASVSWTAATATDTCDPDPSVEYDIDIDDDGSVDGTTAGTSYTLPSGSHRVTVVATDRCGNTSSSCSFTVDVSDQNEVLVDVELSATVASPLTRCITFDFVGAAGSVTVEQLVTFTAGEALGVSVLVPCGEWSCVSARDKLHTLRSTDLDDFAIVGRAYAADFTDAAGDDDRLIGGNLNDDDFIDILDFGLFTGQFGLLLGASDCLTVAPHSDINGSGTVDSPDFTFIAINFLLFGEASCGEATSFGNERERKGGIGTGPVTSITVEELWTRGLGHMTPADLNRDGVLDVDDIAAFARGVRPDHRVGILRGGVTTARWLDRTAWAGGFVPDAITDVYLDEGLVYVGGEATAAMIEIGPLSTLMIVSAGWLDAEAVFVRADGLLEIKAAGTLDALSLRVDAGASLVWHGLIGIGDGGVFVVESGGVFVEAGRLELGLDASVFARPLLELLR